MQTIQILFGHFKWASIVELCSYSIFKLVYNHYYYLCNNTTTATRRTTYPGFSALVGVADGGVGNFGIGLHTDGSTVLSNMWTQCFLSHWDFFQIFCFIKLIPSCISCDTAAPTASALVKKKKRQSLMPQLIVFRARTHLTVCEVWVQALSRGKHRKK